MFELRLVLDIEDRPLVIIDGVPITREINDEAIELANRRGSLIFVGAMAKMQHIKASTDVHEIVRTILTPPSFTPTGEFIISDDRERLLRHGCAGIVWFQPQPERMTA